jgi:glycosyltransferase involved in cell wall biosynthesis
VKPRDLPRVQRQRRALFLTNVDITQNYSGNFVMARALQAAGWSVEIWGPFRAESLEVLRASDLTARDTGINRAFAGSVPPGQLTRIWRQGTTLAKICADLGNFDVVVCSEIRFSAPVALVKRFSRSPFKMIQSCGEFYGKADGVPWFSRVQYRLSKWGWDGLVDVEANRLRLRIDHLGVRCPSIVVPNTTPVTLQPGGAVRNQTDVPVLAYVGSVNPNADLPRLICALRNVANAKFVFALFGNEEKVSEIKRLIETEISAQSTVVDRMPKRDLAKYLAENCDAGIVHYPTSSMNTQAQKFCAPGKLFDFMALGLPVVTTSNPSLKSLIETESLGVAAHADTDEAFTTAVETLLDRIRSNKIDSAAIQRVFESKYSADAVGKEFVSWVHQIAP